MGHIGLLLAPAFNAKAPAEELFVPKWPQVAPGGLGPYSALRRVKTRDRSSPIAVQEAALHGKRGASMPTGVNDGVRNG